MTSPPSSNKAQVSFDEKTGRFHIACPFWMNGIAKGLPNRRWDSKRKVWTAPAIRSNIEYMTKMYSPEHITWTDEAKLRLENGAKRLSTKPQSFPASYAFRLDPWKCQREALSQIYGMPAAALFMDMRTGKTRVIIDEVSALNVEGKVNRALIVCPMSVRKSWQRQFAQIATVPYDLILMSTSNKGKSFLEWNTQPHDLKVAVVAVESLSTGNAANLCKKFLSLSTKTYIAVDESHNIKTHNATRSETAVELARMAEMRRIATGTMLTKHPLDLFMQFEFLDPNIFGIGDFYSFRNRYAIMGGYEAETKSGKKVAVEVVGYDNMDELIDIVTPFVYQVRQKDVPELELLPKISLVREVRMNKNQGQLYKQLIDNQQLMNDDGAIEIQNTLELMLRLQEITGGFVAYENITDPDYIGKQDKFRRVQIEGTNPKIEELLKITEEYDGPTLVWCRFLPEIDIVCKALREVYGNDQVLELRGNVDEELRDEYVQRFQNRRARFIVGNQATGGVGITMSEALVNVYYSNDHNFANREQSSERSTGIKKKQAVVEIDIVCEGSVDETILKSHAEKKNVSEYVKAAIKAGRAQLLLTGDAGRGTLDPVEP